MREDGDPAGRADQFDGECWLRRVVLDEVPRPRGQHRRERLRTVADDSGGHERVGNVRAAHRGPGCDVVRDVIPRERVILGEE